jgi:hypothetical protein
MTKKSHPWRNFKINILSKEDKDYYSYHYDTTIKENKKNIKKKGDNKWSSF